MRSTVRYALLLTALFGVWGCGQKGAKLQKSVVPPDKTLFETGEDYLHKSQYIKARLAFQTLINTYPDSDLSAEAYLAVGDSFYNEGGSENLIQAEDQYKNFIIFFPTNPKAADAQLKIVSLNMKQMRAPDRDPSYSVKAEGAIKRFLEQFPDSDYVPIVQKYLTEVQENLAQSDFGVGQFYAEKRNYAGAKSRFQEILDKYPSFSATDEALYRLADALEKSQNKEEAAIYYAKIASGYPFSKHFDEAKARLQDLGKPVPEVDSQLAQVNEKHLRPSEGFSPLKPFVEFATALGFKGPPDPYQAARKTLEAQKAESEQAAKAGEGGKPGEDILIQTTIKFFNDTATTETTVLGNNPNGANDNAADKDNKKKKKEKK